MHQDLNLRRMARLGGSLLAVYVSIGIRGQNLPAMPPTTASSQATAGMPPAPATDTNVPLHAQVLYNDGQIQVRADNSSLNQILRSISHLTGLKITGGVQEQRVFGTYGPAPLSTILATLIDGTGTNILLLGGNPETPPELILTARAGGAQLPSPNSPAYAMYDDDTDRTSRVPPPSIPTPGTTAVAPPTIVAPPPTGSPAASPTSRAPGQPLTPEMVEQELIQMQAQQDQKKRELDQKIQQEQTDQKRRVNTPTPHNPSN